MGRPLYSRAFKSTPAVRDPEPPIYERWSLLNAFDPDSDEFFDNENAVYEDFVDPVTPVNPPTVEDVVVEEEEEEERDMLVVRMGIPVRNASPIMSESSLSDDEVESPLAAGAEDPAHLVVDAFHDVRQMHNGYAPLDIVDSGVRIGFARRAAEETRTGSHMSELRLSYSRRFTPVLARRMAPYPQRDESLVVPTPSAPIPVPSTPRRSADRVVPSPSTPPYHTPAAQISMSPPPASTPRLYSWARNPSHSASPSSSGPFTNLHARTSYTHLSPALIRIRDVTV
ncbi:hypothetical protein JVU11DRAFT_6552 [Chiua virens]|nr:hypothetical protein JVU11DRAFT_6552 [Chiua virens]